MVLIFFQSIFVVKLTINYFSAVIYGFLNIYSRKIVRAKKLDNDARN